MNDVLEHLGMSEPVFWRHVNVLIDQPAAIAAYPMETARLRRLRDGRRRARAS